MFKLEFSTSNAVFEDYATSEITRILKNAQKDISMGCVASNIIDINGNVIGAWRWTRGK